MHQGPVVVINGRVTRVAVTMNEEQVPEVMHRRTGV